MPHCPAILGTAEIGVPNVGTANVAIELPATAPYRGVVVFLHGFPFSWLEVPVAFPVSDTTTGFLWAYSRTLVDHFKADGWICIQPAYPEDRATSLPGVAISADFIADPGHGTRFLGNSLLWWDHVVEFINRQFGPLPVVLNGGSWGGLHGYNIVANRTSTLTAYSLVQPATTPANIPAAIMPWDLTNSAGAVIGTHALDAVKIPGLICYGTGDGVVGWGVPGQGTCPNDGSYTLPQSNTDLIIVNGVAAGRPITRYAPARAHAQFLMTDVDFFDSYFASTIDPLCPRTR